ncbi:MAG TPA: class I SAM-dependent methyltransferase [Methanosarcinales archaeon]|nr:class I SAM-dependent methyltransferase [Methanosarcinales archaeon]
MDFSRISTSYKDHSLVQRSAADLLLNLLEIGESDDVLDLGCGVGNLTEKIRKMTGGRVVGIDPSEGMIREAVERNRGLDITFEIKGVEELDYEDSFDVIFCNSVFQWFRDPQNAIKNCYASLREGGRIGVQAPAKSVYSPNFIEAIERVKEDPETEVIFAHFEEPWFFLETAEEYRNLFENCGFRVVLSEIESVKTEHTPEEVFNIFSSGAAAGYLNQDFYDVEIGADYVKSFERVVNDAFLRQADGRGVVTLIFNRIFLVAVKVCHPVICATASSSPIISCSPVLMSRSVTIPDSTSCFPMITA